MSFLFFAFILCLTLVGVLTPLAIGALISAAIEYVRDQNSWNTLPARSRPYK